MFEFLDLDLVVLDELAKLEVAVVVGLVVLILQEVVFLLPYLLYEVASVSIEVVCLEAVAATALGMAVALAISGGHVCATEVVTAVGLLDGFDLSTADAAEDSSRHGVAKANEEGEHLVELTTQVRLLAYLDACCGKEGYRILLLLLGLTFVIVWHIVLLIGRGGRCSTPAGYCTKWLHLDDDNILGYLDDVG